jgi:hypothetical protein
MNFRQIDKSPKTFVLVFKTGDELAKGLSTFAEEQELSAASRFSRSRQRRLQFPGTCFRYRLPPRHACLGSVLKPIDQGNSSKTIRWDSSVTQSPTPYCVVGINWTRCFGTAE